MTSKLQSRQLVLDVLDALLRDEYALGVAHGIVRESLDEQDGRFAHYLLMSCLRHYGQNAKIISQHMKKTLPNKYRKANILLHMGVTQLLWMQTPAHAAIHTAVSLAKKNNLMHQSGLINAVLNKISKQGAGKSTALDNLPEWLQDNWAQAYGKAAVSAIAQVQMYEPPLDITVKNNPQLWAKTLGAKVILDNSIRCESGNVGAMEGYEEGQWWVQDVAAMLPVTMLGDVSGKTVLDLCAAPGGKSAQLAAGGALVTSVDRSPRRLQRMRENMQRLKLSCEIVQADLLEWQPDTLFDAILLDAPCSATGTIRRHPDLLLHKNMADIAQLCEIQSDILQRATTWLKPGGIMVYCVCSLQPEEGEMQIDRFLKDNARWKVAQVKWPEAMPAQWVNMQGCLRTLPSYLSEDGGMDGFFAAPLQKIT